jgi:hypothetical protein
MEEDYFGDAVTALKAGAELKGARGERDYLARAQVNALLAIASSLDQVVGELVRIRHAQGDWSE